MGPVQKSKLSYFIRLDLLLKLKVNMNLRVDLHKKLIQKVINDSREKPWRTAVYMARN